MYGNGWDADRGWASKPGEYSDGGWPARVKFLNNILVGQGGGLALDMDEGVARGGNLFDHNLYFSGAKSPIRWAGKALAGLKALQARGQETGGKTGDLGFGALGPLPGRLSVERYRPGKGSAAAGIGTAVRLDEDWRKARLAVLGKEAPRPELSLDLAEASVDYSGQDLNGTPFVGALKP